MLCNSLKCRQDPVCCNPDKDLCIAGGQACGTESELW